MKPGLSGFFCAIRFYRNSVYLYMGKIIEVNKKISREQLDKALKEIPKKRKPIDLSKYAGKIDFGVDGLEYQLAIRNEWR